MGSLRGFSQLESDSFAIINLMNETNEGLSKSQLEEIFENGEKMCKEALDDHYVSLRLIKENVMDMLSTELSKMSKVESELKEKLMQLQLVQDQMQEKEIEANQARIEFDRTKNAYDAASRESAEISERSAGTNDPRTKEYPSLAIQQDLLYSITRVTWDEKKRKNSDGENAQILRGYIADQIRNDVTVFHVDVSELTTTSVSQYLWDYISSGINKEWKRI